MPKKRFNATVEHKVWAKFKKHCIDINSNVSREIQTMMEESLR